jgi:hypothetical protein
MYFPLAARSDRRGPITKRSPQSRSSPRLGATERGGEACRDSARRRDGAARSPIALRRRMASADRWVAGESNRYGAPGKCRSRAGAWAARGSTGRGVSSVDIGRCPPSTRVRSIREPPGRPHRHLGDGPSFASAARSGTYAPPTLVTRIRRSVDLSRALTLARDFSHTCHDRPRSQRAALEQCDEQGTCRPAEAAAPFRTPALARAVAR